MRLLRALPIVALLATATAPKAEAQEVQHAFGLGLQLGAPTAVVGKYYLGGASMMALAFGIGVVEEWYDDDALHLHFDVLWHPVVLARTEPFTLPLYLGVGARYKHDDNDRCYWVGNRWECFDQYDDDDHLGVRGPVGVLMDFNRIPLDIFFELALVVDIIEWNDNNPYDDDDRVSLYGAIGARYYF